MDILLITIILICISFSITTFYLIIKINKLNLKIEDINSELNKYQKYTMEKVFDIKKEIPKLIHKEIGYIEFAQPVNGTKKY
tara:strand:- start:574 stop:819 length:246 start_codon:yes stop_codon:yes gene_type:complete